LQAYLQCNSNVRRGIGRQAEQDSRFLLATLVELVLACALTAVATVPVAFSRVLLVVVTPTVSIITLGANRVHWLVIDRRRVTAVKVVRATSEFSIHACGRAAVSAVEVALREVVARVALAISVILAFGASFFGVRVHACETCEWPTLFALACRFATVPAIKTTLREIIALGFDGKIVKTRTN
jgi:hypothetical protein